jgi:hypothetical protein
MEFNINTSFNSYLIGLLQTDGNYYETSRNRGRITLELSKRDEDIINKINVILSGNSTITTRKRDTNFKNDYESVSLNIFNHDLRMEIKKYLPVGKKSDIIEIPDNVIKKDYWRGIIDGDGSLGITKNGLPFISLVTKSNSLVNSYLEYIKEILNIEKVANRNKRDNAYNVMITNENAQKLIEELYYDNCLSIDRKLNKSKEVLSWKRPENVKIVTWCRKKWTQYEDDFIFTNTLEDSIKCLDRNEKSIKLRLYRLKNK